MDPNNEVNKNIASAYLEMLALEEKKKNEGLDPVNKDAVKKNFKDRKDKDIDNDGDEDESDEYLHNRRKTVSKAIDKDGEVDQDKPKVTSSDADSEKDNDDDRDEKGSVLKKDNDKKKTAEQTKESLFLEYGRVEREITPDQKIELDLRAKFKIIKTKDNKFQVQRFTKGKYVNQGKPYESRKQAESARISQLDKERSSVKESVELDEATDFKSTFDDLKKGDTVKIKYAGLFSSREKKETFKVTSKSIVTKFKIGKITLVKQGEGDTKDKYYLYDRNGEVSMSYDNMGPKGISRDENMTSLVKESVDGENLKELGLEILDKMSEANQKSKRGGTKEEGIIDRLLAGKPKGGAKHWVTKKDPNESRKNKLGPRSKQSEPYESNESVEPSLLMKRIQETHGLVEKRVGDAEQNIDTWDKQVSNRRADDVLDTEMTEKEFMDMHNIDTPEFVDGPKVSNKTMDAIKNSVKSKSATRNNDSSIGESVELNKEENDMYEGMTPMQRALAKVKAQSKDKVSVKKAPWDKDDVKKESVELDEAKGEKPFVGASDGKSWAVNISGVKGGNLPKNLGWQISNRDIISAFKKDAKSTYADAKGKPTIPAVKKHLKMLGATEYYANWKSDSSSYKDDSVQIWYKDDAKKAFRK